MNTLWQDVRFGGRMLRKNAGLTAIVVMTLALGIGAATTIFSFVNGILLESLPYTNPERLVAVVSRFISVTQGDFLEWQQQNHVFQDMAAFNFGTANLTTGGEPVQLFAAHVSPRFAETAGVKPRLGRSFATLAAADVSRSVIISSHLWSSRFQSDPQIVGKTLILDGTPFAVVGVMPEGFRFPKDAATFPDSRPRAYPDVDVWMPLALHPGYRSNADIQAVARLRAGVTAVQAEDAISAIDGNPGGARAADPEARMSVVPLQRQVVRFARPLLETLFGAVGLLLMIACGNAAALLLARAAGREREVAIRGALGAGRVRLVQQFLVENMLLSLLGGAAGLFVAVWGLDVVKAWVPRGSLPMIDAVAVDGRVLSFAIVIAVVTGLVFGALPAFRSGRTEIVGVLKSANRTHTSRSRPLRLLVAGQVALAFVLLAAASLLFVSFHRLTSVDPGFRTDHLLTADVALPDTTYPDLARMRAFSSSVLDRLRHTPGIVAASAVNLLPIGGAMLSGDFIAEGASDPKYAYAVKAAVSPGYFQTMGIPLTGGRDFNEQDRDGAPGAVIMTEALAQRIWPGRNAIGRRLKLGFGEPDTESWRTVVGVVRDIRQGGLNERATSAIYMPVAQAPRPFLIHDLTFAVRAKDDPRALAPAVRRQINAVDPMLPVGRMSTMTAIVADSVSEPRFRAILLGSFAAAALLLIVVGILGVLASFVAHRTREIGIRVTLGARRADVIRFVLSQALGMTAIGLAAGIALAIPLTRLLRAYLFEVGPNDPSTFVGGAIAVIALAVVVSYVPARRAARVDPIVALRTD
jgi:predicted permease